ncbi:hypothetical protein Sjap_006360 [Stephania japonica]|uniref:Zeta toxin domain-containing protein n=1 Tax=Stephania japonica TaxID=461633 RepID=A0AAP0K5R6_9MAGN
MVDEKVIPVLHLTETGHVRELESFPRYVARQLGFGEDSECPPEIHKLAADYLKKCKGCEENIFEFFIDHPDAESLYMKFVEELDRCILGYFSFHWNHAPLMISQALGCGGSDQSSNKFKSVILAATRKNRFDRVTKNLKLTRLFSTLVDEMKAIGITSNDSSKSTDVMVPMAHSQRSPVLLLMGGGMGAGKSTVLKDILKEPFWSGAAADAVVVEADAFKETDVIYKALSAGGHEDMLQTAELVHQSSTDAASSLLVTALNEGRDVIMDGTPSWVPFVEQTVAMARNIHMHRYRMGIGYKVAGDGTVTENYWEQVEEQEIEEKPKRKPYRIELVGVVCDPHLAVIRGIRRAILVKRAVRVHSQLKSHKRFTTAFPKYCKLVDNARLYCTSVMGASPKLIGWKDGESNLLVDLQLIGCTTAITMLKEEANSIYELYNQHHQDPSNYDAACAWKQILSSNLREKAQQEVKNAMMDTKRA